MLKTLFVCGLSLCLYSCGAPSDTSADSSAAAGNNSAPDTGAATTYWQPRADENLRWYWQLQDTIDISHPVDVYNIDIDTPQNIIDQLKAKNIKLICYFSAGTVESWRSDATYFKADYVGEAYVGFEDERWLDVSRFKSFSHLIEARLNRCAEKGFDAVEADNVDAYLQVHKLPDGESLTGTSFGITAQQSLEFILWMAEAAHRRGLGFGLKNAESLAADTVAHLDWALTESCYVDDWCDEVSIFKQANKPVFMTEYVEYLPDFSDACLQAKALGFQAIYRDTGLTAQGAFEECF